MDKFYEYRHVVDHKEIDHHGTVYHANYVRWQGRCREMFLLEHAPSVLDGLRGNLKLITLGAGCEGLAGIEAFDELSIRMRMDEIARTQIGFTFDYVRIRENGDKLVAKGWQRIACMLGTDQLMEPVRVPEALQSALEDYAVTRRHLCSVQLGVGGRA